jgi:hypothetical protein
MYLILDGGYAGEKSVDEGGCCCLAIPAKNQPAALHKLKYLSSKQVVPATAAPASSPVANPVESGLWTDPISEHTTAPGDRQRR